MHNLPGINLAWVTCSCFLILLRFFYNEHVFVSTVGQQREGSINL